MKLSTLAVWVLFGFFFYQLGRIKERNDGAKKGLLQEQLNREAEPRKRLAIELKLLEYDSDWWWRRKMRRLLIEKFRKEPPPQ